MARGRGHLHPHRTRGVRQVDYPRLIAAAFTHRDSRAGDPDLHTHVAISNKVQFSTPTYVCAGACGAVCTWAA